MALTPGTRLAHYDLQSRLGGGGMGEVWKAYDPKLQRTVAIKVPSPDLTRDDDTEARLIQEAKAVFSLEHPEHLHHPRDPYRVPVETTAIETPTDIPRL